MTADDLLRALLLLDIVGMLLLAIFYLRRRPISGLAFLGWGLLAVLVPVLGPFLVIAARPHASCSRYHPDAPSGARSSGGTGRGGAARRRDRQARPVEKTGLAGER